MNEPEPQKDITPIVKSVGVNDSEKLLTRLCDKVFLDLWTYPNPQRKQGKELCDVLAVFENHVFIFSDKNPSFESKKTTKTNLEKWESWKDKAIDSSIRQIKGAEKQIRKNPEMIFVDSKCTIPLPIPIDKENLKIHRIIVAHGAKEACKKYDPDKKNGSLTVGYAKLKDSKKLSETTNPFVLVLPKNEITHVFDSYNLGIILSELDTVHDLICYFEEKEKAIEKYNPIFYFGEEELLAHYLVNVDKEGERHYIGDIGVKDENVRGTVIEEGFWQSLLKHDSYKRKKEADKISYFWDELIQNISKHILEGHYIGTDFSTGRLIVSEMAKESRFVRRILSEAMTKAIKDFSLSENKFCARYFSLENYKNGYYIIQVPPFPDEDYEKEYLPRRREILDIACGAAKNKYPHLKKVIGIIINIPKQGEGILEEFKLDLELKLLNCENWTKEISEDYKKRNKKRALNFLEDGTLEFPHEMVYDFPPAPNHAVKTPEKTKRQRNDPCPCGSGKKYKKCCYLKRF